jgi:hypothetical protein
MANQIFCGIYGATTDLLKRLIHANPEGNSGQVGKPFSLTTSKSTAPVWCATLNTALTMATTKNNIVSKGQYDVVLIAKMPSGLHIDSAIFNMEHFTLTIERVVWVRRSLESSLNATVEQKLRCLVHGQQVPVKPSISTAFKGK